MTAKQRSGLLRLLAEFFAVLIVAAALSYAGHALVVSRGHEPTPAMFKLREPVLPFLESSAPIVAHYGAVLRQTPKSEPRHLLNPSLWLQSWWKAPRCSPLTRDDILMGSALSSERSRSTTCTQPRSRCGG